jgi:hypothetical protein
MVISRKYFLFLYVLLAACTLQTKHRGFIFPDNLDSVVSKIKTTSDLEKELGSPQTRTILGENIWIYYGTDENYHGPFPITYDDKTALLVWSDASGKILKKKIMHDQDFAEMKIDQDETEIPAAIKLNALEELVNNIGRFTPAGLGQ